MAAAPSPRRPAGARTRRGGTATSNFGVGRREGHDATAFYDRFSAPELSEDATVGRPSSLDEIHVGDSRAMSAVADASVALVVTSPPYFAGKAYEEALGDGHIPANYVEYLDMLTDVFAECVRVLEPGGRIAVNVANLGRKPYRSLSADVITILQDRLRLLLRGEIIWQKARGAGGNCAWGSFRSPGNPVVRDITERVVVASKGRFDRAVSRKHRERDGLPSTATITADEFMEATLDLWELPTESAVRVGHPAPFPVELPQRLIEMYTYEGDLVLDPFMGSGSTAVAAVRLGRHYVGYDTDPDYVELAEKRIAEERGRQIASPHRPLGDGAPAVDLARRLVTDAGFTDLSPKRVALRSGASFSFSCTDQKGTTWYVDVVGGQTTGGAGLRRGELLWKALGQASVLREAEPDSRLLVLTTALPARSTTNERALELALGSTVHAALQLGDDDTPAHLAQLASGRGRRRR